MTNISLRLHRFPYRILGTDLNITWFVTWYDSDRSTKKSYHRKIWKVDVVILTLLLLLFGFFVKDLFCNDNINLQEAHIIPNIRNSYNGITWIHIVQHTMMSWDQRHDGDQLFLILTWIYSNRNWSTYTSLYDKRNDFNFNITNYPFLDRNIQWSPAYGILSHSSHVKTCS